MTNRICAFALVCIALLPGCGKKAADQMDFGVVENSVYRNDYLGFRMQLPAKWSVQDQEAQRRMAATGGKMVAGDDNNLKALIKASELQTVQMLAAFKHPMGAPVRFNPSISCVAERIAHMPGIERGRDYHFHTRRVLEASQLKISFPREVSTARFGGKDFDVMHAEIAIHGMAVRQKYYASIMKGYALVCVTSFTAQDDESVLDGVLGTITFK